MKYINQKPLTLFKIRGLQIKDHYSFIRLANTKKLVNTEVGEEYGSMFGRLFGNIYQNLRCTYFVTQQMLLLPIFFYMYEIKPL